MLKQRTCLPGLQAGTRMPRNSTRRAAWLSSCLAQPALGLQNLNPAEPNLKQRKRRQGPSKKEANPPRRPPKLVISLRLTPASRQENRLLVCKNRATKKPAPPRTRTPPHPRVFSSTVRHSCRRSSTSLRLRDFPETWETNV